MSTGFGFGVAKTTALPAFGTGSITFGTPATTTLQNPPGFGFTATPAVPAPVTGFQFGAPTTSTSTPSLFGSTASTLKPTGFGTSSQAGGLFGTTVSAAAPAAPAPGLSFGVPSAATAVLNLGAPSTAASAPTGLFGTAAVPAAPAASFGAPTTAAPALFGATTTSNVSTGLFGAPTTTTATLGFGFGVSSAAPTLGKPTTTSTTGGLTFGIGAPTSSSALTFGLGVATSTASTNPNVVSAPSVVGLGGQASSQMKTGAAVTTQKEVAPKEQPLPNEILQTVEQFKEVVKKQKIYSSDIARCSIRDFKKVEQEIDLLNSVLNEVECQLQKNRYLAEKLKYDTAKSLQNVEMAQRTQDTPPGLQYENSAPLKFFLDLADHFEREMQALKMHIEAADRYVKNNRNPDMLTPQDLSVGIRRLHETFVALAGRLQSVHNQVESQKDIYLNIRRHFYNDPSNPFEKISKTTEFNVTNINNALIYSPPKVATGPTPFNQMMSFSGNPLMQQQNPPAYPGTSTSTAPAPSGFGNALSFQVGTQPSNTSLFGQSTFGNTSTNFQLQKPPTGYKRGKQ